MKTFKAALHYKIKQIATSPKNHEINYKYLISVNYPEQIYPYWGWSQTKITSQITIHSNPFNSLQCIDLD